MFSLDVLQKFELLSGHYAGYQIQYPVSKTGVEGKVSTVNETFNGDLTIKDVLNIALSKTSRVASETDYLIQFSKLYLRFLRLLRDIDEYNKYLSLDENLRQKCSIEKPVFFVKNEYEKIILIDLVDKSVVYPKDESLDNIVRGQVILLLSNQGILED